MNPYREPSELDEDEPQPTMLAAVCVQSPVVWELPEWMADDDEEETE